MLVLIVIVIEVAVCCRINHYLLFVCHLGRANHCDFFRKLEVGGREAYIFAYMIIFQPRGNSSVSFILL